MRLTAHQPAYLPWLGLFHKIAVCDVYYYLENVQYVPCDNISRNFIRSAAGRTLLSVPVYQKGHLERNIKDSLIDNARNWAKKHWSSILFSYAKAPYFKKYADFWEDLYLREWKNLSELNFYILKWHLGVLGITTRVIRAGDDIFPGKKSRLLVDICHKYGADRFLFGALGEEYADRELFAREKIAIAFQHYNHPEYRQLHGAFMPYMACIDLIFNEGPRALDIIMSGNCSSQEIQYH